MGSCLSKGGAKKGKEEEDKAPYSPSQKNPPAAGEEEGKAAGKSPAPIGVPDNKGIQTPPRDNDESREESASRPHPVPAPPSLPYNSSSSPERQSSMTSSSSSSDHQRSSLNSGHLSALNGVPSSPLISPEECSSPTSPLSESNGGNSGHVEATVLIQACEMVTESAAKSLVLTESAETLDTLRESATAQNGSGDRDESAAGSTPSDEQESLDHVTIDPVPIINLKNQIKMLLTDFSAPNDRVINRHQLYLNTRVKLLQGMEKWYEKHTPDVPSLMLIMGEAGMGKTCVASELCKRYNADLVGYHFFDRCNANIGHNNLKMVILWLAHRFCDVFPHYVSTLPHMDKLRTVVDGGTLQEIHDTFLFHPLTDPLLKHPPEQHKLIILDAIDHCDFVHRDTLLLILKNLSENAPSWLRIVVTSRNDNQIQDNLSTAQIVEMKKSNDNMVDIKRFLKEPLGKYMDKISLDGGLTQLAKKTEGLFLTAHVYAQQLDTLPGNKKIAMREVEKLYPTGFSNVCQEVFTTYRHHLQDINMDKDAYDVVLSILLNIREPIDKHYVIDALSLDLNAHKPQHILKGIECMLYEENDRIQLRSRAINDWLVDTRQSKGCAVDLEVGREKLATLCMHWISDLVSNERRDNSVMHKALREYSLKRVVYHLLEVERQQENITTVLCSLRVIQEKLGIDGVNVHQMMREYHHTHTSQSPVGGDTTAVSLKDYMKLNSKLQEYIQAFEKFLIERKQEIGQNPEYLLQIAANYSGMDRIQSNARLELEDKPWIENITAVPGTHCMERTIRGSIKAADVSPDGKTLALVIKDEEYNVKLHLISISSGEDKITPINIKPLNDRVGIAAKFLGQDALVFVGSITTFITNTGRQVQSGIDPTTVELKEKFSIECCDSTAKHLVCGLTTFPWGGKSLHLSVFDLKNKKCVKTFEVLRFRFGGSAQCSIRACAVSRNQPYVCACVKQNPKSMERIIVWNTTKWQVTNSIDVHSDEFSKSLFIGDGTLLIGGGIRSSKKPGQVTAVCSEYWYFKDVSNKVSNRWHSKEMSSLFAASGDVMVCCQRKKDNVNATLEVWNTSNVQLEVPDNRYKITGIGADVSEVMSDGKSNVIFISNDTINIYNTEDLESLDNKGKSTAVPNISEISVHSLAFLPKSDTIIVVDKISKDSTSGEGEDEELFSYTAYLADLSEEEVSLTHTPFREERCVFSSCPDSYHTFRGAGTSSEMCFPSADNHHLLFNTGHQIKVWDRINDTVKILPTFDKLVDKSDAQDGNKYVKCFASPKDNTAAIVYGQQQHRIYLYDLRSGNMLKKFEHKDNTGHVSITDLVFLPSNGQLYSYYRSLDHRLSAWNVRSAECISTINTPISYGRVSPASDRIILSTRKGSHEGEILLRSSDGKTNKTLQVGTAVWLPSYNDSDFEFASDGTIVIGVCQRNEICQVWNAGNGELLRDIDIQFTCDTEVLGMLTNTHALFYDDRFISVDVATGHTTTVMPLDVQLDRKYSCRGLRMSPKGKILASGTSGGRIAVFHCHNFAVVKRTTSLQRMKSITKSP